VPFYVLGLAFACAPFAILIGVINNGIAPLSALFGLPFFLFGVTMLFGRPIHDIRFRAQTAYGVTSHRVIFVSGRKDRFVRSLEFDSMIDTKLIPHGKSGGGVIRFGFDARGDKFRVIEGHRFPVVALNAFELPSEAEFVLGIIERGVVNSKEKVKPGKITCRPSAVIDFSSVSWAHPDEVIRAELLAGEMLLWSSRPRLGIIAIWHHIFGIILLSVWMSFFFTAMGAANNAQIGGWFLWYLIVIKLIGAVTHFIKIILDKRLRGRMAYGITTHRIVIVIRGIVPRTYFLPLGVIADIDLTETGECGGGTLAFGPDIPWNSQERRFRQDGRASHMLYFDLDQDAQLVYRLIRRVRPAGGARLHEQVVGTKFAAPFIVSISCGMIGDELHGWVARH